MLTVQQIFDLGIKLAVAADPRGKAGVQKYLNRIKREYEDMKPKDKEYFDKEYLTNPYPDSFIHTGSRQAKVKRVLSGIDIHSSDILLASQLNERGQPIDLVIAHHPAGQALANLHEVMIMTAEMYESLGIPVHVAEKIVEERVKEVGRSVHGVNHYAAVNVAELLGINFMNTHTITDNLVDRFLRDFLRKKKSETVGDLMQALLEIPEYQAAQRQGAGPKLFAGSPSRKVGKLAIEMTGGTEPSNKVYQELSNSGISTIVGMHLREQSMEKVNEHGLNVIIAGHISSDSLGMNLFLDELEKRGIEIVSCGGLIRVSRNPASRAARAARYGAGKKKK